MFRKFISSFRHEQASDKRRGLQEEQRLNAQPPLENRPRSAGARRFSMPSIKENSLQALIF